MILSFDLIFGYGGFSNLNFSLCDFFGDFGFSAVVLVLMFLYTVVSCSRRVRKIEL